LFNINIFLNRNRYASSPSPAFLFQQLISIHLFHLILSLCDDHRCCSHPLTNFIQITGTCRIHPYNNNDNNNNTGILEELGEYLFPLRFATQLETLGRVQKFSKICNCNSNSFCTSQNTKIVITCF
jgi:hypothetical protein